MGLCTYDMRAVMVGSIILGFDSLKSFFMTGSVEGFIALGLIAIVVGIVLKGGLSNLAAGVKLMVSRPYKAGDLVEGGGHFGYVEDISLFKTVLQTFDNQQVMVPNAKIWGAATVNHSHRPMRGVEMKFDVACADDIEKARDVIAKVLAEHPYIVAEPAPSFKVVTLPERAAKVVVRPFTDGAHYFDVRYAVPEQIVQALGAAGMTTPCASQQAMVHN